jgi:uncharacterized protein DUF4349
MRLLDQGPMDPDIAEELAAIDATLAGEPVDPHHAELAELALLLRAERPQISDSFARKLDARGEQRFGAASASKQTASKRLFSRTWVWAPAATAGALAASIAIVFAIGSSGGGMSGFSSTSAAAPAPSTHPSSAATTAAAPGTPKENGLATPSRAAPARSSAANAVASTPAAAPGGLTPSSPSSSRKAVQSSQLALTTAPNQIDLVAQELYRVLSPVGGIVQSSQVTQTGGLDGSASFQLSIPSSALATAMGMLSQLPHSRVASRTDSTQDVTNQYNGLTTRLADARSLRTAVLKQLALAYTTQQIDSLKARIHDADAEIAAYLGQLAGLGHQINYSQVSVSISAAAVPVSPGSSGGFTIGKAFHTAGRVLTVAAGVALIGLAGLVPVALVLALIWWIATALKRRRREHVLDLA